MSLKDALNILEKYRIDKKLLSGDIFYSSQYVYENIRRMGDPLSEEEHTVLFDTFWNLGIRDRRINVTITLPKHLKIKIIRNRGKLMDFLPNSNDMVYARVAYCLYNPLCMPYVIKNCQLNGSEEAELWDIFQKIYGRDVSARACAKINEQLGIYRIIESKSKWFGKINVLDAGCGENGNGIVTLTAKYFSKIDGYGVDVSIKVHPSNMGLVKVELVKASLDHMPFRNNFFEVIYSSNVMYYFKDERLIKVVKEILRVLKPRGMFVFDEHNRSVNDYKNDIIPLTGDSHFFFEIGTGYTIFEDGLRKALRQRKTVVGGTTMLGPFGGILSYVRKRCM
ncbi:methyltransferase domain-containing protein [Candidatus Woesearchaeota archaeon]|nr:methyltransferase domain-containing protein [Candidatus Woesearchaeota archaeon]